MTRAEFLAAIEIASRPPAPQDLKDAPMIEPWWVELEGQFLHLHGLVQGHPLLPDGPVNTSPLLAFDLQGRWARTASRWYRLGPTWQGMAPQEQSSAGQSLSDGLRQLRAQLRSH